MVGDLPWLIQCDITFSLGGSRKSVLLQDMALLKPYSFEPEVAIEDTGDVSSSDE